EEAAIAGHEAERQERVAPLGGIGTQLSKAAPTGRSGHGKAVGASMSKILEQQLACIVVLGNMEPDFQGSGARPGYLIEDRSRSREIANANANETSRST